MAFVWRTPVQGTSASEAQSLYVRYPLGNALEFRSGEDCLQNSAACADVAADMSKEATQQCASFLLLVLLMLVKLGVSLYWGAPSCIPVWHLIVLMGPTKGAPNFSETPRSHFFCIAGALLLQRLDSKVSPRGKEDL